MTFLDQGNAWRAETLSIGTEIIMGVIADTNSTWLAERLPAQGIANYWITAVGDNLERIVEALDRAVKRSDIVITTGGLGPTDDDLTREAIAALLGETPRVAQELESDLRQRFQGREMPGRNIKQATLIPSAQAIPNPHGTAPGWWTETPSGAVIISMPGVPREMYRMWVEQVVPRLSKRMEGRRRTIVSRTLKVLGLGEARVDELIDEQLESANPKIGVYAKADGTHVRINALGRTEEDARAVLQPMEEILQSILGHYVWGYDDETLPEVLQREFHQKGLTIAVMESSTGGHITNALTEAPNPSGFFRGSVIAPTQHMLEYYGVQRSALESHGLASQQAAQAMAEAVRQRLGADIGLSIAAPLRLDQASGRNEGVTVSFAIANGQGDIVREATYPANLQDLKMRLKNAVLFELLTWLRAM